MGRSAGRAGGGRKKGGNTAGARGEGRPEPPSRPPTGLLRARPPGGWGTPPAGRLRRTESPGPPHGLAQGRGQRRARDCGGPSPDTPHSCRVVHGRGASRPGRPRSVPDAGQRGLSAHRGALELGKFAQQPFSKAPFTPAREGGPVRGAAAPPPRPGWGGDRTRGPRLHRGASSPRPAPPAHPCSPWPSPSHSPAARRQTPRSSREAATSDVNLGPEPAPRAPPAVCFLLGARSPAPLGRGPAPRAAPTLRGRPRAHGGRSCGAARGCAGLGPPPRAQVPERERGAGRDGAGARRLPSLRRPAGARFWDRPGPASSR